MTSGTTSLATVYASLDLLHREDIYDALSFDKISHPPSSQLSLGHRILIHQYIGLGARLSPEIASKLYDLVKKTDCWQRPKYYYNEDRELKIKE